MKTEQTIEETTPKLAHIFLEVHIMDCIAPIGTAKNEWLKKQIKAEGLHELVATGEFTLTHAEMYLNRLAAKYDKWGI